MIKSRRIRWAGHTAHMGEKEYIYGIREKVRERP
jgi:hypothetical protein